MFLSRPIEVVGRVSCVHTGVSYDSLGSELLSFPADPAIGCARLLGLRGDVIFQTLLRVQDLRSETGYSSTVSLDSYLRRHIE